MEFCSFHAPPFTDWALNPAAFFSCYILIFLTCLKHYKRQRLHFDWNYSNPISEIFLEIILHRSLSFLLVNFPLSSEMFSILDQQHFIYFLNFHGTDFSFIDVKLS